ncbi:MAG: decarboxylase, partial [Geminicoccales bacterium]
MNGKSDQIQIDHFFSAAEARFDRWRELSVAAQGWAAKANSPDARSLKDEVARRLGDLRPLEAFQAYPGARLLGALDDRLSADDAIGVARLVRRISGALLARSYRYEAGEWEVAEETADVPDRLPPSLGDPELHNPYFEVLMVTPTPGARWPGIVQEMRRLRRSQDQFVYEAVVVGSFEDAVLG